MKGKKLAVMMWLGLFILICAALTWGADDKTGFKEEFTPPYLSPFFQGTLGPDPGQPDTVFTTIDAPLVIPNGGGDVIIKVWGKTDNTGTGNDIAAFSVPLIFKTNVSSAQVYMSDTTVTFTFSGTAVSGWPIKNISVDSNHINLGGVTFGSGLSAGTHLLAQVKLRVTGPCTLSVDTLTFPLTPALTFTTSFITEYTPTWKQASYPVSCPTCPVNQPPVLASIGPKSVDEGQTLSFKISATDPDATIPVLTINNKPASAVFVDSGNGAGSFVWTPNFTESGLYNVTFKASDGELADSEVVQITVNNVNRPPVLAAIGAKNVDEGQTLSFKVTAADPDGNIPSLNVPNPPANAVFIDSGNGAGGFVFNPDFNQAGVYPVTFIASDGSLADTEIVNITVNNVNRPPVLAAIGAKSVDEGQNLSFKVSASDPDGSTPSLTALNAPPNANFVDSGNGSGGFTFSPNFTQDGVYPVTFIASDGSLADTEIVNITVNDMNRAPVLDPIGPKTVQEGNTLSFRVFASDPDGTITALTNSTLPANAVFVDSGNGAGGFVFTPDNTQAGTYFVTFIASDGSLADSETVTIAVTEEANQPPVLAPIGPQSVDEGQNLAFKVTATDPDGTTPALTAIDLPPNASFADSGNGSGGFIFNPDFDQAAVYNITFIASDGSLADSETVQITVNNVNRPPSIVPIGPQEVDEGDTLSFKVIASDPDGTDPVLTALDLPNNAVFADSGTGNGGFVFTPDFTQAGVYYVTFIASDEISATVARTGRVSLADTEVVQITVHDVNRAPVLDSIGPKTVQEGETLSFRVFAFDPDGTIPTLTHSTLPANAVFVDSGNGAGGFVFTPDFTQSATYFVTFTASDGSLSDSEAVTITVTEEANQPPVLAPIGPKSVDEGQVLSFKVSATDPNGTIPTLTALNSPPNSNFADSGNGNGGFVFSPDFTQAGIHNVTFIASDGSLTDTEIVQITVNDVNQAPVLDPIGPKTVQEENTLQFKVSASDPDGTIPTLSVPNPPANAVFVDSGNGAGGFVFTPDNTQAGTYFVTFIASDGSLADSEIVQILVTEISDTCTGSISGWVIDTADSTGIDSIQVKLLDGTGNLIQSTTTDPPSGRANEIGLYRFLRLPPGNYTVMIVLPPEYTTDSTSKSAIVFCGQETVINFYLAKPDQVAAQNSETIRSSAATRTNLLKNYPNPFNPATTISFYAPEAVKATLRIYNVTGRLVKDFDLYAGPGLNSIVWDGTDSQGNRVASGTYFYRLQAGSLKETRKMVLLR